MVPRRGEVFHYVGVEVDPAARAVACTFATDEERFEEIATFGAGVDLARPGIAAAARLYLLAAGTSYYKTTAARSVALPWPIGHATRRFLHGLLTAGLAEHRYRNGLDDHVELPDASTTERSPTLAPIRGPLIPFGAGIDSHVTVAQNEDRDACLFEVHPVAGPFAVIERAAAGTGLPLLRCARRLDPQLSNPDARWFGGHVPVTAIVSSLGLLAAIGQGRGEVRMSNERSASSPTLRVGDRAVNHQWSKSLEAERMLAEALDELVAPAPTYRSALRTRSELWIAREFARHPGYLATFCSCNHAFRQDPSARSAGWCGTCDKCLFTDLVLAPFVGRGDLEALFGGHEPICDPAQLDALAVLVGAGEGPRPFECVGDEQECAAALVATAARPDRRDQHQLTALAARVHAPALELLLDEEAVGAARDRVR